MSLELLPFPVLLLDDPERGPEYPTHSECAVMLDLLPNNDCFTSS